MTDLGLAIGVFLLLCGSAALGRAVRLRLPETHRTRETTEIMQLLITMLLTFAALVLGLLTASVKTSFDTAGHDRQVFALQLTELDQCLRNFGPGADATRRELRSYTAGVIASTWPRQAPPTGVPYPDVRIPPGQGTSPGLMRLFNGIGLQLRALPAGDDMQRELRLHCLTLYNGVETARLGVIEDLRESVSLPFYSILVFWLMIIFASIGLLAPRNALTVISLGLCALSLSSAVFVILDLTHPYTGAFIVGSADMRASLATMMVGVH